MTSVLTVVAAGKGWVQFGPIHSVMAGLVPAIHVLLSGTEHVDARDKPGHDDFSRGEESPQYPSTPLIRCKRSCIAFFRS